MGAPLGFCEANPFLCEETKTLNNDTNILNGGVPASSVEWYISQENGQRRSIRFVMIIDVK